MPLLEYDKEDRRAKYTNASSEQQAVIYDYLKGELSATNAARKIDISISRFNYMVGVILRLWLIRGIVRFDHDITNIDEFKN